MARKIRIYQPEHADPYTRHMGLWEADTHIAARDMLDEEAGVLKAFAFAFSEGAPATLLDGAWRLIDEDLGDPDEGRDWSVVYEAKH